MLLRPLEIDRERPSHARTEVAWTQDPATFCFDHDELQTTALELRTAYADAEPFSHAVIDGLFPAEVLRAVEQEFPPPDERWRHFDDENQKKYGAAARETSLGPATRNLLSTGNGAAFVDFLQTLTGIEEALIPDPHYKGGGLHQSLPGGRLAIHADFNVHPLFGLDRRVNALLYLNRDWNPDWGGQLELWDPNMEHAVVRVEPAFNRLVVFTITDTAFHGHPEPLQCPPGRARRSLAWYYYTNGRPPMEQTDSHSTLWQRPRP